MPSHLKAYTLVHVCTVMKLKLLIIPDETLEIFKKKLYFKKVMWQTALKSHDMEDFSRFLSHDKCLKTGFRSAESVHAFQI